MLYNGSDADAPPLGSYHGIPANKRALLDSAYEAQEHKSAVAHRSRVLNQTDMGLKDVAASILQKSWSGGQSPHSGKTDSSSSITAAGTARGSTTPGKKSVHLRELSAGQVEVVVTTKDAAAALKALHETARTRLRRTGSNGPPLYSPEVLTGAKQVQHIRDVSTGATISPEYNESDGEEDDRWVGDGVFSINMHHRCRPFNPRVEPLELMVQLDLVPQPLPGGEEMALGNSAGTSHLDTRQSLVLEEASPGFQNSKYNVWSNAAHGYQQGAGPTSTPPETHRGVLNVDSTLPELSPHL